MVIALVGAALAFDPWGATTDGRFATPKAFCLGLAALAAGVSLLRGPFAVEAFDLLAAAYFATGLAAAGLAAPSFQASATALAPQAAALLLLLAVRAAASSSPRFVAWAHGVLVATATALAALMLSEALGVVLFDHVMRRPGATLGNRNFAAAFVAMALPFAALRFARAPSLRRGLPLALGTIAVVLSRCRSVWLGLLLAAAVGAVAGIAWVARARRAAIATRLVAITVIVVASAGVAALAPWPGLAWRDSSPFAGSLERLDEADQGSGKVRLDQHRVAAALVADAPLLGGGPGTWADRAAAGAHVGAGRHAPPFGMLPTPHSDWLRVATESGLIGLAIIAALVVVALAKTRRRAAQAPAEACAVLAALVVAGVHATLDAPFFRPEALAALAVLVGALGRSPPVRVLAGRRARVARSLLAGATACAFALLALRLTGSAIARGDAAPDRLDLALSLYPRTDVADHRALRRGCTPGSLGFADDALALAPHQWGLLRFAERCARRLGQSARADDYGRRALEVEPHLIELERARVERGRLAAGP